MQIHNPIIRKEGDGIEEPSYQKLFNYFRDEHDLILLQTDIQEIIGFVTKEEQKISSDDFLLNEFGCWCLVNNIKFINSNQISETLLNF